LVTKTTYEYSHQLLLLLLLLLLAPKNKLHYITNNDNDIISYRKGRKKKDLKKRHRTNHPMQSGGPDIIRWARWAGLEIIIRIRIIIIIIRRIIIYV
jgi:hypothetical protein